MIEIKENYFDIIKLLQYNFYPPKRLALSVKLE